MWLFYVQQEILYEFPIVRKRFTKDAHSRNRMIVACATRARRENLASEILLIQQEILYEFPIVRKRFAKDAHSRDRKVVAL